MNYEVLPKHRKHGKIWDRPRFCLRARYIQPIDQRREAFYRAFAGKSAAQLKAHWSKMIFTGRGRPPRMVADGDEVKQWIADNSNAIGYIDSSTVDYRVKVLSIR